MDYPYASRHKGPGFETPGEYLCETGILLLALSRYIGDLDIIDHCGLVCGQLLGGSPVESLQSHFILTMSHWSSGLPVCFPSQGTRVQIPRAVLM